MIDRRVRLSSMLLGLGLLLALAPYMGEARGAAQTIKVGNLRLTRTLAVGGTSASLATAGLRAKTGTADWCSPEQPSPEYLLAVKDSATGSSHTLLSTDRHQNVTRKAISHGGVKGLTVTMKRADLPLTIKLQYECYPGHAFVRQGGTVTNTGKTTLVLEEVSLATLQLSVPAADLAGTYGLERQPAEKWPVWFGRHTLDLAKDKEVSFETGRWKAATWLTLWRKSRPEGLVLGWETGAPTHCRVGDPFAKGGPGVLVSLRPAYQLQPGESFEIPKAFIGLYQGDLDEGCYLTQRFAEQCLAWPNPGPDFPYVMFNSWGYERAIDEKIARQAIDLCARLGLEVFVADFGWEDPDWKPKADTFPRGLAPLADLCHKNKLKFGTHLSFTNVPHKSKLYQEHPDWAFGDGCWAYGQGKEPVHVLSLGLPEARQWAAKTVVDIVDRDKLDWFLTDTHLWGPIDAAKHPVRADQDYLAASGFEKTMEEIHERRPKVLIEHCDGGLSLVNYKMMRQHVTSITCDNAQAIDTRLSVFELSHVLPPRYLDKYQQEWRSHYANRSCLLGGPWILMMPIHTLVPGSQDWNELVQDIALYKRYRARIREGKVLHLVAPANPKDKAWDGWDAIGSYNPGEDAAIVFVFRTQGTSPQRVIPMTSLRPEGKYTVTFNDTKRLYQATGREIMSQGLKLELETYAGNPRSHCSEVVLIEPVKK